MLKSRKINLAIMNIKDVRFLILLSLFLSAREVVAQSGKLPPFRMVQSNGKIFKAEDLPMGKPIIIIYFSPECDHCDKMMKDLMKRQQNFKKASIAMITYLPVDKVSKFVQQYNLNKHPNIYVGTEGTTFFLRTYYKITEMPFIALYTKNGDLIKWYTEGALNDLSARLQSLE
jgi:thioredoxin-related protein